jgi:molecular chaperone GrpE (heat shock protein)
VSEGSPVPTAGEGSPVPTADAIRQAVHDELDQVMPHLVIALKRDRAFSALEERLRVAERRLEARRERPVAVELLRVLHRLRHLDFDLAVKAALDQELVGVLAKAGYEEIGEVGEPFDPVRHQALDGATSDGRGSVVELYATGLACSGEVTVPAQVRVAAEPASPRGEEVQPA